MSARRMPAAEKVLYDGDDYVVLSEAYRNLAAARARRDAHKGATRGGETFGVVEAEIAYNKAEAEAAERATLVRVRAKGRTKFRELLNDHPPRPGNEDDKVEGFDRSTFPDALVAMSLEEPSFDTTAERDEWLDSLTDGEIETLFMLAYNLNRGEVADPKALRSPASQSSDATSE